MVVSSQFELNTWYRLSRLSKLKRKVHVCLVPRFLHQKEAGEPGTFMSMVNFLHSMYK